MKAWGTRRYQDVSLETTVGDQYRLWKTISKQVFDAANGVKRVAIDIKDFFARCDNKSLIENMLMYHV